MLDWISGPVQFKSTFHAIFNRVFSDIKGHGIKNYPIHYTVTGTDAMQILNQSRIIISYMAFGPQAEPYQFINESKKEIDKKNQSTDFQGMYRMTFYKKGDPRPITAVAEVFKKYNDSNLGKAITHLFQKLAFRKPTTSELTYYKKIVKDSIAKLGQKDGLLSGLSTIFLDRDVLFRPELVNYGTADKYGRKMLQGHELKVAVNSAFAYIMDEGLNKAATSAKLKTKSDVRREVTRILNDPSIKKPRIILFFREYFDYHKASSISKDDEKLKALLPYHKKLVITYNKSASPLARNTDRLVEYYLNKDKNVLYELLTTQKAVVGIGENFESLLYGEVNHSGKPLDQNQKKGKNKGKKKERKKDKKKHPEEGINNKVITHFNQGTKISVKVSPENSVIQKKGVTKQGAGKLLVTLPQQQRMGILMQPAWLISHSDAMDNHAILRGKWILERLLGHSIPDIPITVDTQLPDEPESTLRHRMRITKEKDCWRCHKKMDPLGLPFEAFNHLGMFREKELGKPVNTTGAIIESGVPGLDGPVKDPFELITRIAKSERAEQVFVRHVFRYWMGRNETLNDAPILRRAHKAYKDNNGSMKALLTELLTSDAFLYRKK